MADLAGRNEILDRHLERVFRHVLREAGGNPPQLSGVELRENDWHNGIELTAWFARSGEPERDFRCFVSRRELMDGPPPRLTRKRNRVWTYDAAALWSRCYEDHYLDRMLAEGDRLATEAAGRGRIEEARLIIEQTNHLARTARSNGHRLDFEQRYMQQVEIDPIVLTSDGPRRETATEIRLRQDMTWRRLQQSVERHMLSSGAMTSNTAGEVSEGMTTARMLESIRALGMVPVVPDWARGTSVYEIWGDQRREIDPSEFYRGYWSRPSIEVGTKEAQERGLQLLKDNLTPEQRQSYEANRYFDVKGGESGTTYRIRHGRQMNIDVLDEKGKRTSGLCALPQGGLVAGDCMLAQKVALECDEAGFLNVANRFA